MVGAVNSARPSIPKATDVRGVTTAPQTPQCGCEGSRGPFAAGKKENVALDPTGADHSILIHQTKQGCVDRRNAT